MTRNTNTQYVEDRATGPVSDFDMVQMPYTDLLRDAQRESAQDLGKAVKRTVQQIGERWTDFRRALADVTLPPAAAA